MPSPPIHYTTSRDETQVHRLAGRVARQAEDAVASYTTPGIETAVVRLLGIDRTDPAGVPLARQFVEWLADREILGTGGAHWLAGATIRHRTGVRPQSPAHTSVAWVLDENPTPSEIAIPVEVASEVLEHAVRGARRTLTARRRARDERLATLAVGPDRRVVEVALEDAASLRDAVRGDVDLVLLICPAGSPPTAQTLRRARTAVDQASARAGRCILLGARGPGQITATLATLAALAGLDALVVADVEAPDAFFARRICAWAGVTFLGRGCADDDLTGEAARALVTEQLAALAGLPAAFWGWVPARPTHHAFLAALFPDAFIVYQPGTDAGRNSIPFHENMDSQILAHLKNWPAPMLDPAALVKKAPGYWNPFV